MKKQLYRLLSLILIVAMLVCAGNISIAVLATELVTSESNLSENTASSAEDEVIQDVLRDGNETAYISEAECPELISSREIETHGHISRLKGQEDLNSIVMQNRDGTMTTYIFAENVKYVDENGKVQDKKTTLTDSIAKKEYTDNYAYTNADNDVYIYFPKELSKNGIILEKDNINIELIPIISALQTSTKTSSEKTTLDVITFEAKKKQIDFTTGDNVKSKSVIDYNNVFGTTTTLRYTPTLNGFKEDIVLDSYTGVNEFSFKLKTNGLKLVAENGMYFLTDPTTSAVVVNIGELVIYSNNGSKISKEHNHYYSAETVVENEEYILTITVDKDFLISEDTTYPVIVDPSFEIVSTNNNIMDIAVVEDGRVFTNSVNDGVGNHYDLLKDMRTFIKFPGLLSNSLFDSIAPPGFGYGSPEIISVKLYMYSRAIGVADSVVKVYPYNTSSSLNWNYSTTNFTAEQFNALGTQHSSTNVPCGPSQWIEFNLTSTSLSSWDKGIVLVNEYEGAGNDPVYKAFASTRDPYNKPKVVVNWTCDDNTSFNTAIQLTLDTVYNIQFTKTNNRKYYHFTPETTGFYTFDSFNNENTTPSFVLFDSLYKPLKNHSGSSGNNNFSISYHLDAGEKYYISVGCYNTNTAAYSISVSHSTEISGVTSTEITTSTSGTASFSSQHRRRYFTITPTSSCLSTITSSNSTCDPIGWVYDSSGQLLASDDNTGSNGNFQMTCVLSAGETYYLVTGCIGTTGSFVVNMSSVIPTPPTNLRVTEITGNSVELDWDTIEAYCVERWLIQYRVSGGAWVDYATHWLTDYTVSGLSSSVTYEFRVYAEVGSAWTGARSEPTNTVTATTLPAQPTNLTVSSLTENSVSFTWSTASPHGADRWRIEYVVGTQPWQTVGTVTFKSKTVSGLSASTIYAFRVFAERDNADGTTTDSLVSDTLRVKTKPAQPTNLTVTNLTSSSLTLSWATASPHGADRWRIEYRTAGGNWTVYGYSTFKSCSVIGLTANTSYEFRVYGECDSTSTWPAQDSLVSNVKSATTLTNNPTIQQILNNIQNSSEIPSSKMSICLTAAQELFNRGYETSFVAGLLANIYYEGQPGLFEYYNDTMNYHLNFNKYLQTYHNTTYVEAFHGKYIYEINLTEVYNLFAELSNQNWYLTDEQVTSWEIQGSTKIGTGLGSVGWSFSRMFNLLNLYREVCGYDDYITQNEVISAEVLMIIRELEGPTYKPTVYDAWKTANSSNLNTADAARSAGSIICSAYESPHDPDGDRKAERAELAGILFTEMIS